MADSRPDAKVVTSRRTGVVRNSWLRNAAGKKSGKVRRGVSPAAARAYDSELGPTHPGRRGGEIESRLQ
jgi:hypothetical protein